MKTVKKIVPIAVAGLVLTTAGTVEAHAADAPVEETASVGVEQGVEAAAPAADAPAEETTRSGVEQGVEAVAHAADAPASVEETTRPGVEQGVEAAAPAEAASDIENGYQGTVNVEVTGQQENTVEFPGGTITFGTITAEGTLESEGEADPDEIDDTKKELEAAIASGSEITSAGDESEGTTLGDYTVTGVETDSENENKITYTLEKVETTQLSEGEKDALLAELGVQKNASGQYVDAQGRVVTVDFTKDEGATTTTLVIEVTKNPETQGVGSGKINPGNLGDTSDTDDAEQIRKILNLVNNRTVEATEVDEKGNPTTIEYDNKTYELKYTYDQVNINLGDAEGELDMATISKLLMDTGKGYEMREDGNIYDSEGRRLIFDEAQKVLLKVTVEMTVVDHRDHLSENETPAEGVHVDWVKADAQKDAIKDAVANAGLDLADDAEITVDENGNWTATWKDGDKEYSFTGTVTAGEETWTAKVKDLEETRADDTTGTTSGTVTATISGDGTVTWTKDNPLVSVAEDGTLSLNEDAFTDQFDGETVASTKTGSGKLVVTTKSGKTYTFEKSTDARDLTDADLEAMGVTKGDFDSVQIVKWTVEEVATPEEQPAEEPSSVPVLSESFKEQLAASGLTQKEDNGTIYYEYTHRYKDANGAEQSETVKLTASTSNGKTTYKGAAKEDSGTTLKLTITEEKGSLSKEQLLSLDQSAVDALVGETGYSFDRMDGTNAVFKKVENDGTITEITVNPTTSTVKASIKEEKFFSDMAVADSEESKQAAKDTVANAAVAWLEEKYANDPNGLAEYLKTLNIEHTPGGTTWQEQIKTIVTNGAFDFEKLGDQGIIELLKKYEQVYGRDPKLNDHLDLGLQGTLSVKDATGTVIRTENCIILQESNGGDPLHIYLAYAAEDLFNFDENGNLILNQEPDLSEGNPPTAAWDHVPEYHDPLNRVDYQAYWSEIQRDEYTSYLEYSKGWPGHTYRPSSSWTNPNGYYSENRLKYANFYKVTATVAYDELEDSCFMGTFTDLDKLKAAMAAAKYDVSKYSFVSYQKQEDWEDYLEDKENVPVPTYYYHVFQKTAELTVYGQFNHGGNGCKEGKGFGYDIYLENLTFQEDKVYAVPRNAVNYHTTVSKETSFSGDTVYTPSKVQTKTTTSGSMATSGTWNVAPGEDGTADWSYDSYKTWENGDPVTMTASGSRYYGDLSYYWLDQDVRATVSQGRDVEFEMAYRYFTPEEPGDPGDPDTPDPNPDPETPRVKIRENAVPLAETPNENAPLIEILDDDVPLVDIPDDDVPLIDIFDDEIPLADVPQTGDNFLIEVFAAIAAGISAVWLSWRKKRENT